MSCLRESVTKVALSIAVLGLFATAAVAALGNSSNHLWQSDNGSSGLTNYADIRAVPLQWGGFYIGLPGLWMQEEHNGVSVGTWPLQQREPAKPWPGVSGLQVKLGSSGNWSLSVSGAYGEAIKGVFFGVLWKG
ncbi:MAG: hypothetical protein JSU70_18300 [Phycisphaerales bacterium]|nr:MAG: hypothetical protein JSU70_18300 [Phycisphaerales bacterium]